MYYAWLGIASYVAGKIKDSYDYLRNALELGERSGTQKVVGYACAWLSFVCGNNGLFDEGIAHGKRAQEIAKSFPSDQYLFFKSLAGMCLIYWSQGNTKRLFEGSKLLLEYGEKTANSRSKVFGHWMNALGHFAEGDMDLTREESERSLGAALDPSYAQYPKYWLGISYFLDGQLQKAEDILESLYDFSDKRGIGLFATPAQLFLSLISITKGKMKQGFKKFEEAQKILLNNHNKAVYAQSESILGVVYTQFLTGPSPDFLTLVKNFGSIVKTAPFADKKAEEHFNKAIEIFRDIGAKGDLGQAILGLGRLHKAKKRKEKARECFSEAVNLFHECDAHLYLKQAQDELDKTAATN
jgi:tetratricopeptide (TPR) repeat protein